jgi:hypothetical protein
MPSTYTPNKSIEQPSPGSYNDTWATPVNTDWAIIDTAFGGVTYITVTGMAAAATGLSLAQYQPPNIVFSGTISADLVFVIPQTVGGLWSVFNNTTGAFVLALQCGGGSYFPLPQGFRSLIICDGVNIQFADTRP